MEIKKIQMHDIKTKEPYTQIKIYINDEDIQHITSDEDFSDGLGLHHRKCCKITFPDGETFGISLLYVPKGTKYVTMVKEI